MYQAINKISIASLKVFILINLWILRRIEESFILRIFIHLFKNRSKIRIIKMPFKKWGLSQMIGRIKLRLLMLIRNGLRRNMKLI